MMNTFISHKRENKKLAIWFWKEKLLSTFTA